MPTYFLLAVFKNCTAFIKAVFVSLEKIGWFVKLFSAFLLDLREAFIDGIFAPAKKRPLLGKTRRGKGARIMAMADACGNAGVFELFGKVLNVCLDTLLSLEHKWKKVVK
jgi:hypothetical protein